MTLRDVSDAGRKVHQERETQPTEHEWHPQAQIRNEQSPAMNEIAMSVSEPTT